MGKKKPELKPPAILLWESAIDSVIPLSFPQCVEIAERLRVTNSGMFARLRIRLVTPDQGKLELVANSGQRTVFGWAVVQFEQFDNGSTHAYGKLGIDPGLIFSYPIFALLPLVLGLGTSSLKAALLGLVITLILHVGITLGARNEKKWLKQTLGREFGAAL